MTPLSTVVEHIGHADPLTEGWLAVPTQVTVHYLPLQLTAIDKGFLPEGVPEFPRAPKVKAGPVVSVVGAGEDAWFVEDHAKTIADGGGGGYYAFVGPHQQASARERGWSLSVTLKVDEADATFNERTLNVFFNSNLTDFSTPWNPQNIDAAAKHFGLSFGVSDGKVIVWESMGDGTPIGPADLDADEFHTYRIDYDPSTNSASVFVDNGSIGPIEGVAIYPNPANPRPVALLPTCVGWGCSSTYNEGKGSFSRVGFATK